jgi:multidrug resistance efflux pump
MPLTEFNSHSEEAQEILGKIPSWTIAWGETVIFLIFIIILIGSCFIKFPERVQCSVTITTANSPINVVARTEGKIEAILVDNNSKVETDDILAVIASNADFESVLFIESKLKEINDTSLDRDVFSDWLYKRYDLGDIQNTWASFSSSCRQYLNYVDRNVIATKQELIREQLSKQRQYYSQLKKSAAILKKDIAYEKLNYRRDSALHSEKLISDFEYESSHRKVLSIENDIVNFESQITSTELQILQNEQQITQLSIQKEDEILALKQEIEKSMEALWASIRDWKLAFLIVSPNDGRVSFVRKWDVGQFIQPGESFVTVVPNDTQQPLGLITIPQSSFGKILEGQKVNVKLNGYPYMEFGMLQGRIEYISSVPEDSDSQDSAPYYTATLAFPDGMKTTYGKEIKLIQRMEGSAEIITAERRLIMRIIDPIIFTFTSGI